MSDTTTLDDVAFINPENLTSSTPGDTHFRYIDLGSVSKGTINWSNVVSTTFASAPSRARRITQAGDSLFGTVRPALESHASIPADAHHREFVASTGFAVIRGKNGRANSRFLHHYLFSQTIRDEARKAEVGSSYPAVNESDIRRFAFPPIAYAEQLRIAEILDTLDDQIRTTAQMIAKLRLAKQGQLEDFFSDLPNSDSQPLSDLVTADICYGIVQAGPFVRGGVPVLTIRDLLGDFTSGIHRTSISIEQQYKRSRTQAGDVLLSIKGTIGRVAIVPQHYSGNISRDMARIRLSRRVLPEFIRQYFLSEIGRRRLDLAVVGTTRAEISIHTLKKLRVPLMSHARQQDVVDSLEAFDLRISSLEMKCAKLHSLKRGLTSDLLTGRVRVPGEASS
jgi:type I restriction enzyme, S subunit